MAGTSARAGIIGEPIDHVGDFGTQYPDAPGMDWTLSDETVERMRRIDENMRSALSQASTTAVG